MINNHIDYIEFQANDLETVKAFYTTCFKWTFTDFGPDYTSFSDGKLNGGALNEPIRKFPVNSYIEVKTH